MKKDMKITGVVFATIAILYIMVVPDYQAILALMPLVAIIILITFLARTFKKHEIKFPCQTRPIKKYKHRYEIIKGANNKAEKILVTANGSIGMTVPDIVMEQLDWILTPDVLCNEPTVHAWSTILQMHFDFTNVWGRLLKLEDSDVITFQDLMTARPVRITESEDYLILIFELNKKKGIA